LTAAAAGASTPAFPTSTSSRAFTNAPSIFFFSAGVTLRKSRPDLIDILDQDFPKNISWDDSRFDFERMIEKTLFLYK
jgi:hypothetical protein